jgi:hypothetical protein
MRATKSQPEPQLRMRQSDVAMIERTVNRALRLAKAHHGVFRGGEVDIRSHDGTLTILDAIEREILEVHISKDSLEIVTLVGWDRARRLHRVSSSIDAAFEKMEKEQARRFRR